jgi:hypothetical protein
MALRYPHQLVYEFLTPGQRLELWYEVSMFDREIRKQKLRREHPHWSKLEMMNEIIRQAFGPEPVPAWLERRLQLRVEEQRARKLAGLE